MEVIESNPLYRKVLFEHKSEDGNIYPIILREWFNPPRIQARFDDNFAKSNGYPDIKTMVEQTVGFGSMLLMFGDMPEWIDMDRNGNFLFMRSDANINMN